MGNIFAKGSVSDILSSKRKRKHSFDSQSDTDSNSKDADDSPKKKKLLTTTQYIYNALFKDQINTDIAIMALGKIWNLHKVYLSQSPYFDSMFNGSWKEATESFIDIKIIDENITIDSLDAVFGSLYSDEILIEAETAVSILATGTLFHLESIIEKCSEVMIENISEEFIIPFYDAACEYGRANLKQEAFKWLEIHLLSLYQEKCKNVIHNISIELMTDLVKSPFLYVVQTEYSLYSLLRYWMYSKLNPTSSDSPNSVKDKSKIKRKLTRSLAAHVTASFNSSLNNGKAEAVDIITDYFQKRKTDKTPFLYTDEGREYLKPFLALRTQYLINHSTDLQMILTDNIIPKDWISNHVLYHYDQILRTDHILEDQGPQELRPEMFNKYSMRCGRILLEPGYQKWRWTGFNFGVDLIFTADSRVLSVRRHHRPEHERLLSFKTNRQLMIRVQVSNLSEDKRQGPFTQSTEILSISLAKNAEVTLMMMNQQLVHPLLVSVNLLMIPPGPDFKEGLLNLDESALNLCSSPISNIGATSINDSCDTNETNNSSDTANTKSLTENFSISTRSASILLSNLQRIAENNLSFRPTPSSSSSSPSSGQNSFIESTDGGSSLDQISPST